MGADRNPVEDFTETVHIFVEAVERHAWAITEEALRVAFLVADFSERHGQQIENDREGVGHA